MSNHIMNFSSNNTKKLEDFLVENYKNINKDFFEELLKTVEFSLTFKEITRLHSKLICELKDSLLQQSQRYADMLPDFYQLPTFNCSEEKLLLREAELLTEKAFDLYSKMSELKEEYKEQNIARPLLEHYKHGIPVEDARYILPLACQTVLAIRLNGSKLPDLFKLLLKLSEKDLIAKKLLNQIKENLPNKIYEKLWEFYSKKDMNTNREVLDKFINNYKFSNNKVELVSKFQNLNYEVASKTIISQLKSPDSVEKTIKKWRKQNKLNQESKKVVKRVLGYGHDSIAELTSTTFLNQLSLCAYHQYIRHRHFDNLRESLLNVSNSKRLPVIPASILNSPFYKQFIDLVFEFQCFREKLIENNLKHQSLYFLLNCEPIRFIASANARADVEMLSQRLCMNSQWEIRNFSLDKLVTLYKCSNVLYEAALPNCFKEGCKEGKLSCDNRETLIEQIDFR